MRQSWPRLRMQLCTAASESSSGPAIPILAPKSKSLIAHQGRLHKWDKGCYGCKRRYSIGFHCKFGVPSPVRYCIGTWPSGGMTERDDTKLSQTNHFQDCEVQQIKFLAAGYRGLCVFLSSHLSCWNTLRVTRKQFNLRHRTDTIGSAHPELVSHFSGALQVDITLSINFGAILFWKWYVSKSIQNFENNSASVI